MLRLRLLAFTAAASVLTAAATFAQDDAASEGGSSTGWLRTTWTIQPHEVFTLTFHIHDTNDEVFDSAVLLDNFQWKGSGAKPGTEG